MGWHQTLTVVWALDGRAAWDRAGPRSVMHFSVASSSCPPRPWRPLTVSAGVVSAWLMLALASSSHVRRRITQRCRRLTTMRLRRVRARAGRRSDPGTDPRGQTGLIVFRGLAAPAVWLVYAGSWSAPAAHTPNGRTREPHDARAGAGELPAMGTECSLAVTADRSERAAADSHSRQRGTGSARLRAILALRFAQSALGAEPELTERRCRWSSGFSTRWRLPFACAAKRRPLRPDHPAALLGKATTAVPVARVSRAAGERLVGLRGDRPRLGRSAVRGIELAQPSISAGSARVSQRRGHIDIDVPDLAAAPGPPIDLWRRHRRRGPAAGRRAMADRGREPLDPAGVVGTIRLAQGGVADLRAFTPRFGPGEALHHLIDPVAGESADGGPLAVIGCSRSRRRRRTRDRTRSLRGSGGV